MAPTESATPADRTVLSTAALEIANDVGAVKPPTFSGVEDTTDFDAVEQNAVYRPEEAGEHSTLTADVRKAFKDAVDPESPTGSLTDSARPGAAYFHTEWLSKHEAARAVAALPEMPAYDFLPNRVADQIGNLAPNALVAVAREVVDGEAVPAIYVWSRNPATSHLFAHATPNSQALYFDVCPQYPHVDEDGAVEGEHVLAAVREWSVSRVLFVSPH